MVYSHGDHNWARHLDKWYLLGSFPLPLQFHRFQGQWLLCPHTPIPGLSPALLTRRQTKRYKITIKVHPVHYRLCSTPIWQFTFTKYNSWYIHTARERDRYRGGGGQGLWMGSMGSNMSWRNIHIGLKQGQRPGPIVSYCASPVLCTNPIVWINSKFQSATQS